MKSVKEKLEKHNLLDKVIFHADFSVIHHAVKKNGRSFNRFTGRPYKSANLLRDENHLSAQLIRHSVGKTKNINQPIWVIFEFQTEFKNYFTKNGVPKKTLPDLSNLYELPQDCMQRVGIIENDNLIKAHDWSRHVPGPETRFRVWVLPYESAE